MSTNAVAIIGFLSLFGLMLLRVPVGMAMGLVGVCGFSYLVGGTPALKLVGQTSMRTVTDYTFGVIPRLRWIRRKLTSRARDLQRRRLRRLLRDVLLVGIDLHDDSGRSLNRN